ncbi:MAG: hydroxyacid dehydrogenase, partial [Candidatus Marinimicrobia bacterium]|nr:hydroxyacid dehydrogenase [Candidatus Neomarinimicrobiota bacterium]
MLILISDAFAPDLPEKLSPYGDVTDDKGKLPEATVVIVRSKTKVTKEYIDSAQNLKLVIRGGVGLDNIDLNYAAGKGITVHNTAAASSIAVAELAFALIIALPNNV